MTLIPLAQPRGTNAVGVVDLALWAPAAAVRVWYPAEPAARGVRARYRPAEHATLKSRVGRALIRVGARNAVAPACGCFPLLIYVASWGGGRGENTALAHLLASRGFVVAALDDHDPEAPMDFSSRSALARTQRRCDAKAVRGARRLSAVIEALSAGAGVQRSEPFMAQIDPSRVGALGFSFGGAVAADAARIDDRIAAAANLDGWMFGEAARSGVPKPYLVLGTGAPQLASGPPPANRTNAPDCVEAAFDRENEARIVSGVERCGGYFLALDGSRHLSFSDAAVLPSLRRPTAAGPLGGRRAQRIIAAYLADFLDRYVAGRSTQLFGEVTAPAPTSHLAADSAVRVKVWRPPPEGIPREASGSRANG